MKIKDAPKKYHFPLFMAYVISGIIVGEMSKVLVDGLVWQIALALAMLPVVIYLVEFRLVPWLVERENAQNQQRDLTDDSWMEDA